MTASKPVWSVPQIVDNLTRWDARWGPAHVPYTFYETAPAHLASKSDWSGFVSFSPVQREATRQVLALIADVANITFVEAPDNGSVPGPANPRLTFSTSLSTEQYFTGYALVDISEGFDLGDAHDIYSAELMLNAHRWADVTVGQRPFYVLIHEILHGLGLPHPGAYNRSPGEEITFDKHAEYAQDSAQFTVMSYFGATATGANHSYGGTTYFAATPLLHDVAALQALYGPNMSTRTGDTVYGFNSTAGRDSLDFTVNTRPVICIWDAGGNDTLDVSGYLMGGLVDLRDGAFSNIAGMIGNLSIAFGAVIENAVGGAGQETMFGNAAGNRLSGGGGDDLLFGLGGNDVLLGGEGADSLVGGAGADLLDGGAGLDSVWYEEAAEGGGPLQIDLLDPTRNTAAASGDSYVSIERVVGSQGWDIIWGTAAAEVFAGRGGGDDFVGRGGGDLYDGGEGIDTVWYEAASPAGGPLQIDLLDPTRNTAGASGDRYVSIERVMGSQGWDILWGANGADRLHGRGGNDDFVGRGGGDHFDGGEGFDTVWYFDLPAGGGTLVIDLLGLVQQTGEAAGDTFVSIERVIGSAGSDAIYGTGGYEVLWGGAGDDFLYGRGGGDLIDGGAGYDRGYLDGAAVNGVLHIDLLSDFVNVEEVYGTSGIDVFLGTTGQDILVGRGGNDEFLSRGGGDILLGEEGFDTVWYETASVVDLGDQSRNAGGAAGDRYVGIERAMGSQAADALFASNLFDSWLFARGGDDYLEGRDRNDRIGGGQGADVLFGGGGRDSFVYLGVDEGGDRIIDFMSGADRLEFDRAAFGFSGDSSQWFVNGSSATAAGPQLIWDAALRTLFYDADGTGAGQAVAIATLDSGTVTSNDILFI